MSKNGLTISNLVFRNVRFNDSQSLRPQQNANFNVKSFQFWKNTNAPESMPIILAVQQTNQTDFFLTCRPPVSVWRRFMHCWFNGLLPERFWRLLSEKQPWKKERRLLQECSQELSPKSKTVGTDMARKQTAHKLPRAFGLNVTYLQWWDSQGRDRGIALLLTSAERQQKVMYFTNNGSNMGLLLTPVWFHVKFPFQMACPRDKVLVATLCRGWLSRVKMSINRCVWLRVGEPEMSREKLWSSFLFRSPLSCAYSCHDRNH